MQALIAHKPIIVAIFASVIAMVLIALLIFVSDRIEHKRTGDRDD